MTIDELKESGDWAEVFADHSSGNTNKDTEGVKGRDATPPSRDDVIEILASRDGEPDGDSWRGVFKLKDGRFLFAEGSCDYTGWD